MRVCFLADAGAVNTRTWVDHFADVLGHEVHVVSVNRPGTLSPSVRLHRIGSDAGTASAAGKLALLASVGPIRRIVREVGPDLLIGYRVASYGYLGARAGFHPLVATAQGQYIVYPPRSLPKRYFARVAIRSADLLHAWAPHMARRMVELGADPAKVFVCPRGIDLEKFAARPDAAEDEFSVVTTRGLHHGYRVDIVVRAVAEARREVPGISALVAGGGEAEEALRALAAGLGVGDRVRFPGHVMNGELPGYLARSAVYVSPVPSDGVSASLLEAMACGAFPVVRDIEANRFWVEHGKNGFLVAGDDPGGYAAAIAAACRDHELRRAAAERNRRIVEERGDIRVNMKRIEAAYGELVARASSAR
ncbi:MAG: glycosyltransferase family 4 protein [Candidatus Eisenbacteria bacterium]|nr:glycosyltransferase family 4 protein [Candidatus Eisenbacteria bacterium]